MKIKKKIKNRKEAQKHLIHTLTLLRRQLETLETNMHFAWDYFESISDCWDYINNSLEEDMARYDNIGND